MITLTLASAQLAFYSVAAALIVALAGWHIREWAARLKWSRYRRKRFICGCPRGACA